MQCNVNMNLPFARSRLRRRTAAAESKNAQEAKEKEAKEKEAKEKEAKEKEAKQKEEEKKSKNAVGGDTLLISDDEDGKIDVFHLSICVCANILRFR